MGLQHVAALIEADNFAAVEAATFGHLAPETNRAYPGVLLFTYTNWGQTEPIESNFPGMEDNPWFYRAMGDFIYELSQAHGEVVGVYRWEGTYTVKVTPGEKPDDFDPEYDAEPPNDVEHVWLGNTTILWRSEEHSALTT